MRAEPGDDDMRTFRIHSAIPEPDGRLPYVALTQIDHHCVQLNLAEMDLALSDVPLCLSLRNVYTLLEGKSIQIDLPCIQCAMEPQGDMLRMDLYVEGDPMPYAFRLELAEVALAWNLIASSTAAA
jgi:hypothetical protein